MRTEAVDVEAALAQRVALLPGGRDLEGRPLVLVPLAPPSPPASSPSPATSSSSGSATPLSVSVTQPEGRECLSIVLRYLVSVYSAETRSTGVTVVVDAREVAWRTARAAVRVVVAAVQPDLRSLLVLRPEAWQRVDSCTRSKRKGEPIILPISRLHEFISPLDTPPDLGGQGISRNLTSWIESRILTESFFREAEAAAAELDRVRTCLMSVAEPRVYNGGEEEYILAREQARKAALTGRDVLDRLDAEYGDVEGDPSIMVPQDVLDSQLRAEKLLEAIASGLASIADAWSTLQAAIADAKELSALERGVASVTDWILGPAETLLDAQRDVGRGVADAEALRAAHEALELQCRPAYARYAELLHRLECLERRAKAPGVGDLKPQRDFMDFACRSFANRLERRRNVLISSLRFYRLVDEYLQTTSDVLDKMITSSDQDEFRDLDSLDAALWELQEKQEQIDEVERALVRQGEKLSDLLAMPVKDALGRELPVDYGAHIGHVSALMEAVRARRSLFADSASLRCLTLRQARHVRTCEREAEQAVQWLDELFAALVGAHGHVGCSVREIQSQKAEHQALQDTARGTHEYGLQLVAAAEALRGGSGSPLSVRLAASWTRIHSAATEQMTRLRVSAVFHRSVEEQCEQLRHLCQGAAAAATSPSRTRSFLAARERLLVEVGRMVRLGRLLRERLREPIGGGAPPAAAGTPHCNSTAIEAISERLAEVTALAEQLDRALAAAQLEPTATAAASAQLKPAASGTGSSKSTSNPEIKLESTEEVHSDAAVLSTSSANTSGDAGESEWCCSSSPPAGASASCGGGSCAGSSTAGSTLSNSSSRTLTAVEEIMPQRLTLKAATSAASCRSHFDDRSSSDDFLTASECTCTPPSRSSSFHTASEGGVASPWWEHSEDGEDGHAGGAAAAQSTPLDSATVARHQDMVETRVPLVASPIPVPAAYLSDSADTGEVEVLTGIFERRSVTETRQLQVRRGGAETRAVSQASVTETKLTSLRPSPPPTPPPPLPLPLPLPLRADEAYLLDDLPLPSPPPPPFADEPPEEDLKDPDPLGLLKEVSETALPPPPSPPPPPTAATARFYCNPHLARHAIKGIF